MPKRLYLGNLPYTATEQDVREFLAPRKVLAVDFIADRQTGRPRGFGFAELEDSIELDKVVAELNGMEMGGRPITVSPANEKPRSSGGGGGGGGRRDHGGGRNGQPRRRRGNDSDDPSGWHG